MSRLDKDLRASDIARREKWKKEQDARSVETHAQDNARGKLKIRSRTSGPCGRYMNHKKPRGSSFINPKFRFVNPMAQFGWTDEEYKTYLSTGKRN